MGSPVLAIAWSTWRRHRRGIRLAAATLAGVAVAYPLLFSVVRTPGVVIVSSLPPVLVLGYFMNVLLFTNEVGDLASGYQRRLYVLPVRTVTLVTWPMLFGAAGVALLWIAFRLIYERSGWRPPVLIPALSLAALMCWLQALAWSPFAHRLARIILAGTLLPSLAAPVVWLWRMHSASPGQIAWLLSGYCGAAYILALAGVSRDRCGHLSLINWRSDQRGAGWMWRERARPYGSPAAAQFAYEWRSHGLMLPGFAGGLVAASLLTMSVLARPGTHMAVAGVALLVPLMLSSSLGGNISHTMTGLRRGSTFLMTRPMTSADLAVAKFRMAFASVLLTWAVVIGLAVLYVAVAGVGSDVAELGRSWLERLPGWKGGALALLAVIAVPILTWKQFTNCLILRLAGRTWLVTVAEFAKAAVILLVVAVGLWFVANPDALARFQAALPASLPWLIGGAVIVKACVAAWAWRVLLSRRLVEARTVRALLCGWFVASTCVAGLIAFVLPPEQAGGMRPLVLPAVLAWMPLNRFALAPLALEQARRQ
jgi:hypothetical protein